MLTVSNERIHPVSPTRHTFSIEPSSQVILNRDSDHYLLVVVESCSSKRVCVVPVPNFSFGGFLVACSNGAVPEPLFNAALKAAAQRP